MGWKNEEEEPTLKNREWGTQLDRPTRKNGMWGTACHERVRSRCRTPSRHTKTFWEEADRFLGLDAWKPEVGCGQPGSLSSRQRPEKEDRFVGVGS